MLYSSHFQCIFLVDCMLYLRTLTRRVNFKMSIMLANERKMTNCPVCNKPYPVDSISNHVEKCLFLKSGDGHSIPKRQNPEDLASKSPTFPSKKFKSGYGKCNTESLASSSGPSSQDNRILPGRSQEHIDLEKPKPLADRSRPTSLNSFVGQEKVVGKSTVLRNLIEQYNFPSMILWGPPGCGKTSLANVIQKMCQEKPDYKYIKMSATTAGVNDVKEVVQIAKTDLQLFKKKTIIFMDEIHRFNKLQQDIFLPSVEKGLITLIGATTENPSFSLNNALLSRCRVFVMEKLAVEDIVTILYNSTDEINVDIIEGGENPEESAKKPYRLTREAVQWLAEVSDGDARIALNSLQMSVESKAGSGEPRPLLISLDDIKEGVKKSHLLYDRKGDEHYNMISALHKSIRASDDNAALYWLTRMLEGGEDPIFIARRLVRAASEDVGIMDPLALTLMVSTMQGCQLIGMPECDVLLAQAVVYLARTHKSQEVYRALLEAKGCVKNHKGALPSVPLHLRNAPTKLMKDLGYGRDYNMQHKDSSGLTYMPEGMENVTFFRGD